MCCSAMEKYWRRKYNQPPANTNVLLYAFNTSYHLGIEFKYVYKHVKDVM